MIKTLKMIVICAISLAALSSCMKNNEAQISVQVYSVIKSGDGGTYFSSDDGFELYPVGGFNSQWGNVGDRILVGFSYNPYAISETTRRMDITVESLMSVPTYNSALPSTVDTVGSGVFTFGSSSDKHAIFAWAAQNYLTVQFFIQYYDASQHSFGFIEESERYRNDTLFLTLWHNAREQKRDYNAKSHLALNLSDYNDYLSSRDSTVIAIKYKTEKMDSSDTVIYTYPVAYKKKNNISGLK
jgi:hypothetical protein